MSLLSIIHKSNTSQQLRNSLLKRLSTSTSASKDNIDLKPPEDVSFIPSLSSSSTTATATDGKATSSHSSQHKIKLESLLEFDQKHIWHPYTSLTKPLPVYAVASANENKLILEDGRELIDGMSSWWCTIHGYNHPKLNEALYQQISKMSHVMFGGLTHRPAMELCHKLVEMTPTELQHVFLCDSGSVSVEVAIKMALQYHMARNEPNKSKLISIRRGYHGDTFGAMSVCDPETGMHHIFEKMLSPQIFIPPPMTPYPHAYDNSRASSSPSPSPSPSPSLSNSDEGEFRLKAEDKQALDDVFANHHSDVAAFILEPIVQGAGGMRMYSPAYLHYVRKLCSAYNVLLIADEIATGFGRTGELFACNHTAAPSSYSSGTNGAGVQPDIMCLGKALTGGTMTMAATLCTENVAHTICTEGGSSPGVFMHGPTFMANPLASSVALASIQLLEEMDWKMEVKRIEGTLMKGLMPLLESESESKSSSSLPFSHSKKVVVKEVRVLGAIGVVECHYKVNVSEIQNFFVDRGVWIRPFNKTIYVMPPYITSDDDLRIICQTISDSLNVESHFIFE